MQRLYVEQSVIPHLVRSATTGTIPPALAGILGTELDLGVYFMRNGNTEAIAAGTTGGKLTLIKKDDYGGEALVLDAAWEVVGTGAAAYYRFTGILDNADLRAAIGTEKEITLVGNVEWLLQGAAAVSKTEDFEFVLKNSASRPEQVAPAANPDTSWAWLKARAPEANGFIHDDEAKTLEVDAGIATESDPVASAALATHAAQTDNPHATTKAQVGLGNCDNTSDANKPVSTATQAALDGKASEGMVTDLEAWTLTQLDTKVPTTRAVNASGLASGGGALSADRTIDVPIASQAEAEAGTINTRAMTPLRVAQAIAAFGGGGGGGTALMRGSGLLQGHTDAGTPGSMPPPVVWVFQNPGHTYGSVTLTVNGADFQIWIADTDPSQTPWLDTSALTTAAELATLIGDIIDNSLGNISVSVVDDTLTLSHTVPGASSTLAQTSAFADLISGSGGGSGVDEVPPSGGISEVTLIALDGSKTVKPVRAGWSGAGVNVEVSLALKVGGTYYPIHANAPANSTVGECVPESLYAEWIAGRAAAALVARMASSIPVGGSLTCWAIAEQN